MDEPRSATRGIRGAITVDGTVEEATAELLDALTRANDCRPQDVAAAIFTLTEDMTGANPAAAARARGWADVPLLMVREHGGDTGISRCLRVLLLWNTETPQDGVRHMYLRGAAVLRPDLDSETHVGGKP
jgi:chorismate mutase